MSSLVCQQIIALDAKYKNYRCKNDRSFRTAYIRRRIQLLREYSKNNIIDYNIRREYLKLRKQIINKLFGPMSEISSMIGSSIRSSRLYLDKTECNDVKENEEKCNSLKLVPTEHAEASRKMAGGTSVDENYAFRGMHHIFDDHAGHKTTAVKFANDEKDLFAYSSMSGSIFICTLSPNPTVLHQLQRHDGGTTDFCWSLSNDLIISVGFDSSLRLWQANTGTTLRVILSKKLGLAGGPVHCCLFQPLNNNMVLCGNGGGQVFVVNISTGKLVKNGLGSTTGAVISMSFDSSGRLLWCGTDNGHIYSFKFDLLTGSLTKLHEMLINRLSMITSIQSRSWASREASNPSVLVNVSKNLLSLYKVVDETGLLQLKKNFHVKHTDTIIKSVFCPIMSFRRGACVVSGSEDGNIAFFDIERATKTRVNLLQGHSSAVVDVSFNHDESMLVSCDVQGSVFVWKKG